MNWLAGMRAKLGLSGEEPEDEFLIRDLLQWMENNRADFTNTFRTLTLGLTEDSSLAGSPEFVRWHERWQARLGRQQSTEEAVRQLMRSSNPSVIPRNHRVEAALEAAQQGDYSVMERLLAVLANPYGYTPEQEEYTAPPEPSACAYQTFCGT
ncbi:hypothetical protein D3C75_1014820 [compost metagenome]